MKTLTGRARLWLFGCAGLTLGAFSPPGFRTIDRPDQDRRDRRGISVAGASLTRAAVMAADDINAHGGVSGRKIEVIAYDNH